MAPSGSYLPSRAVASVTAGASSLAADAATLARWCSLLYGGHVIPADLVTQMTTPDPAGVRGLGSIIGAEGGQRLVGHSSHTWAYRGMMLTWTTDQISVAVLAPGPPGLRGSDVAALAVRLHALASD